MASLGGDHPGDTIKGGHPDESHKSNGRFAFLRPPLQDLGATHDDHLRLICKHVVDFPLVLIILKIIKLDGSDLQSVVLQKFDNFARDVSISDVGIVLN